MKKDICELDFSNMPHEIYRRTRYIHENEEKNSNVSFRSFYRNIGMDNTVAEFAKGGEPTAKTLSNLSMKTGYSVSWLIGLSKNPLNDEGQRVDIGAKEQKRIFSKRLQMLIQEYRKKQQRKVTKSEIAIELDMDYERLQNYCQKKTSPRASALYKICYFFEVSADWMLGLSDIRKCEEIK